MKERSFSIFFKKAFIKANLLSSKIEIYSNKTKRRLFYKKFKIKKNELFLEELRYLKKCNKIKKELLSIENNLNTIKLIDQIKKFKVKNL